jgi:hypothetical protein
MVCSDCSQESVLGGLQPRLMSEGQLGGADGADGQGAELGFRLLEGAHHRLAIDAEPLRFEQHDIAEIELLEHAGPIEQAEHGLEGGVVEAGGVDALAQALAQILVGEQGFTAIAQAQDLRLDPLEQAGRGVAGQTLPGNCLGDGRNQLDQCEALILGAFSDV